MPQERHIDVPKIPQRTIDIHAHIFNGLDIPAVGFFNQVILKPNRWLKEGVLHLLKSIIFTSSNTPTAKQELESLKKKKLESPQALGFLQTSSEEPNYLEQDRANVAKAIEQFITGELPSSSVGFALPPTPINDDDRHTVIKELYKEINRPDKEADEPPSLSVIKQNPKKEAEKLSEKIYELAAATLGITLRHILWAGLFTRLRQGIYKELVSLYGGEKGIQVYSPSLVDFQCWFKSQLWEESVTPIRDLIDVMSALAKSRDDAILLNFVGFCPLRSALERLERKEDNSDTSALANVKYAIEKKGFAGVKLYPPLGFLPLNNKDTTFDHASHNAHAKLNGCGEMLDKELRQLYDWCDSNDVPIKAHAEKAIEAKPGAGRLAAPDNWVPVLKDYPNLRLNLAHFGGFDETKKGDRSKPLGATGNCEETSGSNWENRIATMLTEYPNLFCDLSYWTQVVDITDGGTERARVVTAMNDLIDRCPVIKERMMYGSDWPMIGKGLLHPLYAVKVIETLRKEKGENGLGLTGDELAAVTGGNARRYLGLDDIETKQYQRLSKFFGNHPVWQSHFTSV